MKPFVPKPWCLLIFMLIVSSAPPAHGVELLNSERLSLNLGGFVATQTTFDTNESVVQSQLTNVPGRGRSGRQGFAFDATRMNFALRAPAEQWLASGRFEFDLESATYFRVRHAYVGIENGPLSLLLGKTGTLIGNWVGPHLFNNDWLWAQGNAYDLTPQLRITYQPGRFYVAVAAVTNVLGATDAVPHGQLRVGYRFGESGSVGFASHFGRTRKASAPDPTVPGATREVGPVLSYLEQVDLAVGAGPALISVAAWYGAAGGHGTGGHTIGGPLFVADDSGHVESVPAAGGFADVVFAVTPKLSMGVAGGVNFVTATSLLGQALPVRRNATAGAYASYALTGFWTGAFEVQWANTRRALDAASPGTLSSLNDVRVLLGSRFSF